MSSLTISIIQTNLFWEDKVANLQMLETKINAIPHTEIVFLPEMFSTGFSMQPEKFAEKMDGHTVAWMKHVAANKKIILCGSLMIEENGQYFNRLIWMLPNGQMGTYDKRHLFAYAKEDEHYTAGNKRLIASVKGWSINLMVCYDLRFPVWARQKKTTTDFEYDMLVYVANWPERRRHAWRTLLQARAIENQCYCVGVNRVGEDGNEIEHSGDSMLVDPLGGVIYQIANGEDVFTTTLQKEDLDNVRAQFPFWKDADDFMLGFEINEA